LQFAQSLPESDLLFMRRDITQMDEIDEWLHDIEKERAITLLVETHGQIIAYGTLHHHQLYWNRHMAELRVVVSSTFRNQQLGKLLARELIGFAKELGMEKVIAYMPADSKGAQVMLQRAGFKAEALLTDWVMTRDNKTHDLVIMSIAVNEIS
jgi:RimJ/RimL family protein N-acetyltransferase